jgi:hypothetical protein
VVEDGTASPDRLTPSCRPPAAPHPGALDSATTGALWLAPFHGPLSGPDDTGDERIA